MSTATAEAPVTAAELLDEDGLIRDYALWSEDVARILAREERIAELTDPHWKIIRALRSEFLRVEGPLTMRNVCHEAGIDRADVNRLFGYCLVAWRVAGLPNPGEEAKSYLGSM